MLRAVWIGILGPALVLAAGGDLQAVLARMDQASATLKDLSADLSRTHHLGLLDENTEDSGVIYIKRPKPHELLMRVDIQMPAADAKEVAIDARQAEVYYPKSQIVQIYEIGKYKKVADQLLLLGFGTTSKDLAQGYTVSLGGPETVNGQKTARLELTPKADELHLQRVDLWISDATGLPVQQKLYWPGANGGDYDLAIYRNVKINPNLPNSAFKLNLPPGVKREYPQK